MHPFVYTDIAIHFTEIRLSILHYTSFGAYKVKSGTSDIIYFLEINFLILLLKQGYK